MQNVRINQEETTISEDIFERLANIPLIDKYEAYQLLDDEWAKIAADLEMIQTEGFEATKKVNPNLVIKKKDGKEQEIQEGWVGHIIPFDLIQATILKEQKDELTSKEARLSEIPAELEAIIDEMSEDEKDGEFLNDDNTAFVPKEVAKKLKELKVDTTEEAKVLYKKLKR